ncbi:MAG: hypothetical protein IKE30_10240 [Clostridia bacterium]|nr:hypothetical protein [Clostridia bacterium]
MKRVLTILLALMLLMTTAFAETTQVITISNLSVSMTADGEPQQMDIPMDVKLAGTQSGENEILGRVDILGGGQKLIGADFKIEIDESRFVMAIDGVSTPLYAVYTGAPAVQGLQGFQLPEEVMNELVAKVMTSVEYEESEDGMTVRLPYTAVNEMLLMLAPTIGEMNIEGLNAEEFEKGIQEMIDSNSGIEVYGSVSGVETGSTVADLYCSMVQNGEVMEDAMASVHFETDGQAIGVDCSVADAGSFHFDMYPEGGAFAVNLSADTPDGAYALSMTVSVGEEDVTFNAIENEDEAIDVQNLTDEQMEALQGELQGAAMGLIMYIYMSMAGTPAA